MANKYKNSRHLRLLVSLSGVKLTSSHPDHKHRATLVSVLEANTRRHFIQRFLRPLGGTFADHRLFREGILFRTLEQAHLNYNLRPLNDLCDAFQANTLEQLIPVLEAQPESQDVATVIRMIRTKNRQFRFAVLGEVYAHYLSSLGYPLSTQDSRYDATDRDHRVAVQSGPILFHQAMITNVLPRPDRTPLMADLGLGAPHNT
ncbi:hypothetical protein KBA63_01815 [Candidatus Woesebacteria bacterium]|nr:hypothetical protein [Candidatus Woesebacteria bacterium]